MSRPLLEVADLIRSTGIAFIKRNRNWISWTHIKVLLAIARCRTAALGGRCHCFFAQPESTVARKRVATRPCMVRVEDDMDVGRGEKFEAPGLDPAFASAGLTLRTVPIATAVAGDGGTMSTTGAFIDYAPPPAPTPDKDFDAQVDATHLDPNGVPLNLDWHPQLAGIVPSPDACNDGQPYTAQCTQNQPFEDQPSGFNAGICALGKVFSGHPIQPFFGHSDWMVTQQTGAIGWFNFGADFDYGLMLAPNTDSLPPTTPPSFNGHGITTNNSHVSSDQSPQYIEMEFDSDEVDPVFTQNFLERLSR